MLCLCCARAVPVSELGPQATTGEMLVTPRHAGKTYTASLVAIDGARNITVAGWTMEPRQHDDLYYSAFGPNGRGCVYENPTPLPPRARVYTPAYAYTHTARRPLGSRGRESRGRGRGGNLDTICRPFQTHFTAHILGLGLNVTISQAFLRSLSPQPAVRCVLFLSFFFRECLSDSFTSIIHDSSVSSKAWRPGGCCPTGCVVQL